MSTFKKISMLGLFVSVFVVTVPALAEAASPVCLNTVNGVYPSGMTVWAGSGSSNSALSPADDTGTLTVPATANARSFLAPVTSMQNWTQTYNWQFYSGFYGQVPTYQYVWFYNSTYYSTSYLINTVMGNINLASLLSNDGYGGNARVQSDLSTEFAHSDAATINRVCTLIDPSTTGTCLTGTGNFSSPGDDNLMWWNGSAWQNHAANDGNSYIQGMTCTDNNLPANTLAASPASITSGQSSTLSFNEGSSAAAINAEGTTCTTSSTNPSSTFTIPTLSENLMNLSVMTWGNQYNQNNGGFGNTGSCFYMANSTAQNAAGSNYVGGPDSGFNAGNGCPTTPYSYQDQADSVTVSPTVTTTYTYTCTNGNGTTVASTTVTVAAATPVPTATLSATPASITSGSSSTLAWTSTNATSCTLGLPSGGVTEATSSSAQVSPSSTTTYSLSCTGAGGTSALQTATVTVTAPPPAPVVTFSAYPTSIVSGNSSTLTWSATNAISCTATTGNFSTGGLASNSTGVAVSPTTTTTYGISCTGGGGTSTGSVTVTVTPVSCTPLFSATPSTIVQGQTTALAWSEPSSCASSCTGTGFSTGNALSGTTNVTPQSTSSYALTCGAQPTVNTTVTVNTPTVTLSASPTRVAKGGNTALTWSSTNTTNCTVTGNGGTVGTGRSGNNVADPNPVNEQTTYTATCTTNGSNVTATTVVNVVPGFQEF